MSRGNPGMIVETAKGKQGRTFTSKGLINGKVPVYVYYEFQTIKMGGGLPDQKIGTKHHTEAILCDPDSLKIIGRID